MCPHEVRTLGHQAVDAAPGDCVEAKSDGVCRRRERECLRCRYDRQRIWTARPFRGDLRHVPRQVQFVGTRQWTRLLGNGTRDLRTTPWPSPPAATLYVRATPGGASTVRATRGCMDSLAAKYNCLGDSPVDADDGIGPVGVTVTGLPRRRPTMSTFPARPTGISTALRTAMGPG